MASWNDDNADDLFGLNEQKPQGSRDFNLFEECTHISLTDRASSLPLWPSGENTTSSRRIGCTFFEHQSSWTLSLSVQGVIITDKVHRE